MKQLTVGIDVNVMPGFDTFWTQIFMWNLAAGSVHDLCGGVWALALTGPLVANNSHEHAYAKRNENNTFHAAGLGQTQCERDSAWA